MGRREIRYFLKVRAAYRPRADRSYLASHDSSFERIILPVLSEDLTSVFSTVSSSINALVAVTVEDFILPVCKNLTEKQVTWMNMGLSKLKENKTQ